MFEDKSKPYSLKGGKVDVEVSTLDKISKSLSPHQRSPTPVRRDPTPPCRNPSPLPKQITPTPSQSPKRTSLQKRQLQKTKCMITIQMTLQSQDREKLTGELQNLLKPSGRLKVLTLQSMKVLFNHE